MSYEELESRLMNRLSYGLGDSGPFWAIWGHEWTTSRQKQLKFGTWAVASSTMLLPKFGCIWRYFGHGLWPWPQLATRLPIGPKVINLFFGLMLMRMTKKLPKLLGFEVRYKFLKFGSTRFLGHV